MEQTRGIAVEWLLQEENQSADARLRAGECWETLLLSEYPVGLDYFLLDTAVVCSPAVGLQWLSISLEVPVYLSAYRAMELTRDLSPERSSILIAQLCFSRRRRHKTEPGWVRHGQAKTNRVNRVQHRALKLIREAANGSLAA